MRLASEIRPDSAQDTAPRRGIPISGVDPAPDPPGSPGAEARLGRILDEWHRRSAAHSILDVRFTLLESDLRWREEAAGTGRIVLTSAGRMRVDLDRDKRKTHHHEVILRGKDEVHVFHFESKSHIVWPIAARERGRLPVLVALPFCWNLSIEGLKSRFRVELVTDDPAGTCLLRFTPLTATGRQGMSKAFVELDHSTVFADPLCPDIAGSKIHEGLPDHQDLLRSARPRRLLASTR